MDSLLPIRNQLIWTAGKINMLPIRLYTWDMPNLVRYTHPQPGE